MKNVTFHISFDAENESDFAFANSIVTALKVQSGAKVKVQTENAGVNASEAKAPATAASDTKAPAAAAPETKAPATVAPETKAPATTAPAPVPEAKAAAKVEYTCEDARKAMASKLANHRTALVDKLRSLGAKNISTLPQDKYAEFIDFCNSLTD